MQRLMRKKLLILILSTIVLNVIGMAYDVVNPVKEQENNSVQLPPEMWQAIVQNSIQSSVRIHIKIYARLRQTCKQLYNLLTPQIICALLRQPGYVGRQLNASLHDIIATNDQGMVWLNIMLCAGADKDGYIKTKAPLHRAVQVGYMAYVQKLLDKGADPTLCDYSGRTPLHYAAQAGNDDMLNFFLQQPINKNARDNEGKTPLIYAAANGYKRCVCSLLKAGANSIIPDRRIGRTAAQWARGNEYVSIANMIENWVTQSDDIL